MLFASTTFLPSQPAILTGAPCVIYRYTQNDDDRKKREANFLSPNCMNVYARFACELEEDPLATHILEKRTEKKAIDYNVVY